MKCRGPARDPRHGRSYGNVTRAENSPPDEREYIRFPIDPSLFEVYTVHTRVWSGDRMCRTAGRPGFNPLMEGRL